MHLRRSFLSAGLVLALAAPAIRAEVKPHPLFCDNMVLQEGAKVPIWGTAAPGETVEIVLERKAPTASSKMDIPGVRVGPDGRWMVTLFDLKHVPGETVTLTIKGKDNTVEIKNVAIGEVWICSGQSNMEWKLKQTGSGKEDGPKAANPNIRFFDVPNRRALEPRQTIEGKWVECTPDTAAEFSAVGYYFGRDLQKDLNVPIGLIESDWGGTAAEAWTSREALLANPALRPYIERLEEAKKTYDPETGKKQYQDALAKWMEADTKWKESAAQAKKDGKPAPKAPGRPPVPEPPGMRHNDPTNLYNAMIAPLIPYGIKGVIWYQGESNAGKAYEYRTLFPTMIQDWRTRWGYEFPFLFVQLAPFMKIESEPKESAWAELREAQSMTLNRLRNTGEAVITDVGEENNIHPQKKEPVGHRLALAAEAIAYGKPIEYTGPVLRSMRVDGNKAILTFSHAAGGLVSKGADKPTGFTIAGPDHQFHNAEAIAQGEQVIVSAPGVEKPAAVRFGWANYPVVNLWNKAGLPASPFRTDDWPGVTQSKK
jgi:sialate O-acetylesterase